MQSNARVLGAETVGTALLVIGGCGAAYFSGGLGGSLGQFGIAVAFGASLMIAYFAIGRISGCHVNPAVTLGLVLARRVPARTALFHVLGQIIGGFIGAGLLWSIASSNETWVRADLGTRTGNGWAQLSPGGYGLGAVIVVEVIFTALLVFVYLVVSKRSFPAVAAPVAVGLTLALINLVVIPIDDAGVNPIRSLAIAVFTDHGQDYLQQVWAFIVFPLIGAVVGVFLWLFVDEARLESTMLFEPGLAQARDLADHAVDAVVDEIEEIEPQFEQPGDETAPRA